MIIADTSGLIAAFVRTESFHRQVVHSIETAGQTLVISPYVLAELDYILTARTSTARTIRVLRELAGGAYVHADFGDADFRATIDVIERYADQDVGLTDASLVVLAARHQTHSILTLDRRHFEVLRPLDGGRFDLLPA